MEEEVVEEGEGERLVGGQRAEAGFLVAARAVLVGVGGVLVAGVLLPRGVLMVGWGLLVAGGVVLEAEGGPARARDGERLGPRLGAVVAQSRAGDHDRRRY